MIGGDVLREVANGFGARLRSAEQRRLDIEAVDLDIDAEDLRVAEGFGDDVLRISGIRHVSIEGLVLRGATGSPMIHVYGSEGIHLDHLSVYGGFPALLVNASKNVRVTHSAFRGVAAPWSGWARVGSSESIARSGFRSRRSAPASTGSPRRRRSLAACSTARP